MLKLQSAIEYLTTYGWAILLMVCVILALFQLGVFNSNIFAPRAMPGSCQVYRPDGPGTRMLLNLEGLCTSAPPEYVMTSRGIGDYVIVSGSNSTHSMLNITGNTITITAWVFIYGAPYHDVIDKEYQYGMKIDYNNQPHSCTPSNNRGLCLEWDTAGDWVGKSYPIPNGGFNKWIFLALSMNGNQRLWYANGQYLGNETTSTSIAYVNSLVTIGAISPGWTGYGEAEWFNGSISNVQLYNSSLSANAIKSLYVEGVSGPPINLQTLVAWWPLNGNANDYSGDLQNGFVYNTAYSGTLISQYTPT